MAFNKEAVLKNMGLCARCRQCRMVCETPIATTMLPICPTGECWKFDTYFGSGRVTLAKKILLETVDYDESIHRVVYSCTLCGSCKQQCPILNFDPMEATTVLREIAAKDGSADKYYRMPEDKPLAVNFKEDDGVSTALFVGTNGQSSQEAVDAVAKHLQKAGVKFKAFTGTDCGEFLLRKGDIAAFEQKKLAVTKKLAEAGVKKIIAHEPMTYKVLASNYDLAGIEVVYYLELLKGSVKGAANKKAAFHDPSYLGRYMGFYDLPREILSGLGYAVTEMVRTKENAITSGGFADAWPKVAGVAAKFVIDDALATGADILVTSSYYATKQLQKTAQDAGVKLEIKDICDLL